MVEVSLSPSAEREIQRRLRAGWGSAGSLPNVLRVTVRTGGCYGLTYDLGLEREVGPQDRTYTCGQLVIAIDAASLAHLAGARLAIDYAEDLVGGAFRLEAVGSTKWECCDCGDSFRMAV